MRADRLHNLQDVLNANNGYDSRAISCCSNVKTFNHSVGIIKQTDVLRIRIAFFAAALSNTKTEQRKTSRHLDNRSEIISLNEKI
jgi:hypothetical protein